MPRDRDNRSKPEKNEPEDELPEWDLPETQMRAIGILNEIVRMTPRNDPRLDYMLLLRHQLETDENQLEEAQKVIAEFEEAYNKLTSPANRIGSLPGRGGRGRARADRAGRPGVHRQRRPEDGEPVASRSARRVKVNEAFAVIGDLGYASGRPDRQDQRGAGRRPPARRDGFAGHAVARRLSRRAR